MKNILCLLACLSLVASLPAQTINAPTALAQPQPIPFAGIENYFRLTENVYSGSSPVHDEAFADLQKRGIKTIVSVDGEKPHVEAAKKYGLRYVHLPIGYDGVPTNRVNQLVKTASAFPDPIYVHCHHGKHRGPAGAAVICMGAEGWTPEQALNWLKQAGTATNYTGLYQSIREFKQPSPAALAAIPANLPEKMEVSPLVDAMVEIDERFDHLQLVKEAGYKQPPAHPDINPAHEALLLHELFKELLRSPETKKRHQDFQAKLAEAEQFTRDLHGILDNAAVSNEKADAIFQNIINHCASCHKAHRN